MGKVLQYTANHNHLYNIIPKVAFTIRATWTGNKSLNIKAIFFANSDRWWYQLAGRSTALQLYKTVHCVPGFQRSCLITGIWEGMETTGKLRQMEVTENSVCYCSPVTLCSNKSLTIIYYQLIWYFRKIRLDKVSSSFFNHALPKFKVRSVSSDFRVEGNLLKRTAPQK